MSQRANGRANGPVLQSVFLAVLAHSALASKRKNACLKTGLDLLLYPKRHLINTRASCMPKRLFIRLYIAHYATDTRWNIKNALVFGLGQHLTARTWVKSKCTPLFPMIAIVPHVCSCNSLSSRQNYVAEKASCH